MNQGTVNRRRRIKLYAVGVSVFAHIVALSVFAAVKITQSAPVPLQSTTVVSISQAATLAALAEKPAVAPKPKVSPAGQSRPITRTNETTPAANIRQTFDIPTQEVQPQAELPKEPARSETTVSPSTAILPERAEFFDSPAQGRRICYVVDCSGSMQGLWQRVKEELIDSIGQLQQDQYFCVIIFGAGSILESGGGKMARATEQAKKDAYGLIDSVRPRGGTNAAAAMEYAIKIKDRSGTGPSLIYFLTDGFELSEQDNSRFAHRVVTMLRSFAPKTQINTIGFWCGRKDSLLLETIAKESSGQFTLIGREQQNND